jgi:hypothetical protein
MAERGMIIRDPRNGAGLLAVKGKQYSFVVDGMWHSPAAPEVGMPVDVTFNQDGAPERVQCAERTQPERTTASPEQL